MKRDHNLEIVPKTMPKVSVVIPVYNSAKLLNTALRSVFEQTYSDFEVVVVDDGSDDRDELEAVLASWGDAVHCVRQANGGPAKARNTAIAHATGELIAFLDADDEWLPEKLQRQVAYFEQYPQTGLLHTGVIGQANREKSASPPRRAFCDLFHTEFFINTLTVMIPITAAFLMRINVEESALSAALGEPYRAYMRRTKRLVPLHRNPTTGL